jgi:hypothetical protein
VKVILQQATEAETKAKLSKDEVIQRKSAFMLQQIESHLIKKVNLFIHKLIDQYEVNKN